MTLRQNVRNFLLPLTIAEVRKELEISVERGDARRAGYIEEFLDELEADFNGCDEDSYLEGFDGSDDCIVPKAWF